MNNDTIYDTMFENLTVVSMEELHSFSPSSSKNLTNVDVNWLTQPYLAQHPWKHDWIFLFLYVLYTIYFRIWFIHYSILRKRELRKTSPIYRFLTILSYLNMVNCLSSILMTTTRLETQCDGIYGNWKMISLVLASIISDWTYRSGIWILIAVCFLACFGTLNKRWVTVSAIIISSIILVWSILIRTVTIRYDSSSKVMPDFSCRNNCCTQGIVPFVPNSLELVFNILKAINDYINLIPVMLMVVLIPVLLCTLVNSFKKAERDPTNQIQLLFLYNFMFLFMLTFNFIAPFLDRILPGNFSNRLDDVAYWTPMFTVACQLLQIFSCRAILPAYSEYWIRSFSTRLCCGLCCVPKKQ